MANRSSEAPQLPSSRAMRRGLQVFLMATLTGLGLVYWWKTPSGLTRILSSMDWAWLSLVLPLLTADFLLGGWRYRLFFDGRTLPRISLWDCMRSNWANIFLGVVTPFQSGGGAAQLYVLWRCGATVAQAVLVSLINFTATLLFFQVAALTAYWALPGHLVSGGFSQTLEVSFLVVFAFTGLVVLTLFFPNVGFRLLATLARTLPEGWTGWRGWIERGQARLERQVRAFADDFRRLRERRKSRFYLTALATVALFGNKYLMGYVLARSLHPDVPFVPFLALQCVQLFIIYFAPTPGASGVAELSSTWLLATLLPQNTLLLFTVGWRFFTTYCAAAIGWGVLLVDLPRGAPRSTLPEREKTVSVRTSTAK